MTYPKWDVVQGKKLWDENRITIKEMSEILGCRVGAIKRYAHVYKWKARKGYTVKAPLTYAQVMKETNKLYTKRCPNCGARYRGKADDDTAHCNSTALRSIYELAA